MTPKRKTRMYEPWGYQDQNNYQGAEIIHENDLDSFFAGVEYKRDDNKIHFTNKDGDEVGSLNVSDFIKSDSIIEKTEYKDGILKIYFTNGDIVTIKPSSPERKDFVFNYNSGFIVRDSTQANLLNIPPENVIIIATTGIGRGGATISKLSCLINKDEVIFSPDNL